MCEKRKKDGGRRRKSSYPEQHTEESSVETRGISVTGLRKSMTHPYGASYTRIPRQGRTQRGERPVGEIESAIRIAGQWIEEKDSVEASGNSLVEQNQRDRRMIEEDRSNGRWHLSHRPRSHGDGPEQGLAVKMDHRAARRVSSKRLSRVPGSRAEFAG